MAYRHEKRIEQGSLHRIIETCLQREYQHQHQKIYHQKAAENCQHHRTQCGCCTLYCQEKVQIKAQQAACCQHNQPDDGRLSEILLKGSEKGADRGALFIPHQLQGHIINRCSGSAHRHNRNAAQHPKHIQNHDVAELADKSPERIIIIKNSR